MPQAAKTTTTSRRKFLAVAAGAALSTSVVAAAPDPVFGALAKHRAALINLTNLVLPGSDLVHVPDHIDAACREAANAECEAVEELIATVPTTKAGVLAVLTFLRDNLDDEYQALEPAHLITVCKSLETALQRIV